MVRPTLLGSVMTELSGTSIQTDQVLTPAGSSRRSKTDSRLSCAIRLDVGFVDHRRPLKPATDSSLAERHFCGHFWGMVVSHSLSLRRDIVFRSLFARLSPTSKIPFQTLLGGDAKVRGR